MRIDGYDLALLTGCGLNGGSGSFDPPTLRDALGLLPVIPNQPCELAGG